MGQRAGPGEYIGDSTGQWVGCRECGKGEKFLKPEGTAMALMEMRKV